jgi:hypothetical protein
MAQWTITDSSTGAPVVYTFPINPSAFTHPPREATVTTAHTVSPSGGTVVFQGQDKAVSLSFDGLTNTEAFYDALVAELDKWYPVVLTDDQGNTWNVIFTKSLFKRVKRATNHWRFDYSVTALVLR